jgi:hypothetical protein
MMTVAIPTPTPEMVRPAYQQATVLPGKKSWRMAPMLKMREARTMAQRRPNLAVKGQTKKQAKKAWWRLA